ncbi:MAG: DNA-directed RNA polymerase [Bifidobacterium crudilactis]|jgi:hypothetical protein
MVQNAVKALRHKGLRVMSTFASRPFTSHSEQNVRVYGIRFPKVLADCFMGDVRKPSRHNVIEYWRYI